MRKRSRPPLGQHFLDNGRVLERIVEAAEIVEGHPVIEIGAGTGNLTAVLIARRARVLAIEMDSRLALQLRNRFQGESNLEVLEADVLEAKLDSWIARQPRRVAIVGNLPYYITSPILRKVCELQPPPAIAVFLMQKEVAQRVTARPGQRDYGFLSALCDLYGQARYLFEVPRGAFRPPPDVTSAVVRFDLKGEPVDREFVEFLKTAFAHPRKKLRNNLAGRWPKERLPMEPRLDLRPSALGAGEYLELWLALKGESQ